jgi:hypothetical protein
MSNNIQPPPHPADRYPLREYDLALNDLIGLTPDQVLAKLGEPNSKGAGNRWSSGEGIDHKTFVRLSIRSFKCMYLASRPKTFQWAIHMKSGFITTCAVQRGCSSL